MKRDRCFECKNKAKYLVGATSNTPYCKPCAVEILIEAAIKDDFITYEFEEKEDK